MKSPSSNTISLVKVHSPFGSAPFLPLTPFSGDAVLLPRADGSVGSIEESLELFGLFLDFIAEDEAAFTPRFHLFIASFMPSLYPEICKKNDLLDSKDRASLPPPPLILILLPATGFTKFCPADVQCLLIERLGSWFQHPVYRELLWLPDINSLFLMEILHQTTFLPRSKEKEQQRFYRTLYSLFFENPIAKLPDERLRDYQVRFFEMLPRTWAQPTRATSSFLFISRPDLLRPKSARLLHGDFHP